MEVKDGGNAIFRLLKNDKARKWVVVLGICGIVLIYLSTSLNFQGKEEKSQEPVTFSTAEYERQLEENLQKVVSAITGESAPVVLVTLKSTGRTVYAVDEKSSSQEGVSDSETIHVLLKDSDGAQHALAVTEIQPSIKGVVVVSKHAENAVIREKLTDAVKTALDISSAKVCVTGAG